MNRFYKTFIQKINLLNILKEYEQLTKEKYFNELIEKVISIAFFKQMKKQRRLSLPVKMFEQESIDNISGEEKRLGGSSPIITILILSIGPFISQTVQALYGQFILGFKGHWR